MVTGPMAGLAPFEPISSVTPFTYRDNATYLSILKGLENKVNELVDNINEVSSNNAGGLNALRAELTAALAAVRAELLALIEALDGEASAFNPTNGKRTDSLSKVISNVYDYARVFAYFAGQFDDLEMTAAEFDALDMSARHFDLGVTYPSINDVRA